MSSQPSSSRHQSIALSSQVLEFRLLPPCGPLPPLGPLPQGYYPDEGTLFCKKEGHDIPFSRQVDLDRHDYIFHNVEPPLRLVCIDPACNDLFEDLKDMQAHLLEIHRYDIPEEKSASSTIQHKSHWRYPFICVWEPCFTRGHGFQNFEHLYYHFHMIHTRMIRMYNCNQEHCDKQGEKGFLTQRRLADHYRRVHKILGITSLGEIRWVSPTAEELQSNFGGTGGQAFAYPSSSADPSQPMPAPAGGKIPLPRVPELDQPPAL